MFEVDVLNWKIDWTYWTWFEIEFEFKLIFEIVYIEKFLYIMLKNFDVFRISCKKTYHLYLSSKLKMMIKIKINRFIVNLYVD